MWRLSSELQQSMRDRMCELRPGGKTAASGGGCGDSVVGGGGGGDLGVTGGCGGGIGTAVSSDAAAVAEAAAAEAIAADERARVAVSVVS